MYEIQLLSVRCLPRAEEVLDALGRVYLIVFCVIMQSTALAL